MSHLIIFFQLLTLLFFSLYTQIIASSFSSASPQQCHHEQSNALLKFKESFSISTFASENCNYPRITSYPKILYWKKNVDCCSWDGVTCDGVMGHVIGLNLNCSQLQGTIDSNSTLFLLSHLQQLNLAYNDFLRSPISSKFGQFANLTYLNLSSSTFSGHIPLEISHLTKLVSLDLSYNYDKFTRFNLLRVDTFHMKNLVQNLTELIQLNFYGVNMSSIEIGSLKNLSSTLTALNLRYCGLRGKFPNDIFHLPNLHNLDLSYNDDLIINFPKDNSSSALKSLALSGMSFSGQLPNSISNLQSLNYLDLSSNGLNGTIPAWLGNFTQLSSLSLYSNSFSGPIPLSLSKLNKLINLDLSRNHFNGLIPAWLGNFTQLSSLSLHSNSFSSHIPLSLSKLDKLINLDLSSNNFHGSIPAWLGNFTQLSSLSLYSNSFSGHIPLSLSKLNKLINLDLSSNNFNGSIPASLGNLTQISHLDLSFNNFCGQIPSSILKLEGLNYLNLAVNYFSGPFPSSGVEQLPYKNLQSIDLQSNMFQGPLPIPPLFIQIFIISNNKFSGNIPYSICNASFLQIMDLSNNSFSGIIPQCLGSFSNSLSVLDLRMNYFHGTIPKIFAKGNKLRNLHFNGNKFEGPIPKSLKECKNLKVLDLGNNKINDTFPNWLDTLPQLQVLILRSNGFYGTIGSPMTKFPFPKLQIIDLSHNEFTGLLPTDYFKTLNALINVVEENTEPKYFMEDYYEESVVVTIKGTDVKLVKILTIFTILDLSKNKFQGEIPELIGMLTSLRLLNFSHNYLTGQIPSSLESLRNLESLDLSSNNLIGVIPVQLTNLTFLGVLNLSQNHLEGPIPQGKQFDTFANSSYYQNSGLCGVPLSNKCSSDEIPQRPPSIEKEDNSEFGGGFGWKVVLMGYASGMVIGLAWGYYIFLIRNPEWFLRILEVIQHKNMKRSKKSAARRRRGRRN